MDDTKLAEYIDQNRWLINNGLWSDNFKNQLFMLGSIVNLSIEAVDVAIDSKSKKIAYTLYGPKSLVTLKRQYDWLSTSRTYFGMWRFKRFLKKHGSLDFQGMLDRCVKDICGPGWYATSELHDIDSYIPGTEADGGLSSQSQLPDQLPDSR